MTGSAERWLRAVARERAGLTAALAGVAFVAGFVAGGVVVEGGSGPLPQQTARSAVFQLRVVDLPALKEDPVVRARGRSSARATSAARPSRVLSARRGRTSALQAANVLTSTPAPKPEPAPELERAPEPKPAPAPGTPKPEPTPAPVPQAPAPGSEPAPRPPPADFDDDAAELRDEIDALQRELEDAVPPAP